MTFHIGQKVVCVDASLVRGAPYAPGSEVVEGAVYTIRNIGITNVGDPGVRLMEIKLNCRPGHIGVRTRKPFADACYRADRFRPIVERKTDISFAREILRKTSRETSILERPQETAK
jgi:hypothetical protein